MNYSFFNPAFTGLLATMYNAKVSKTYVFQTMGGGVGGNSYIYEKDTLTSIISDLSLSVSNSRYIAKRAGTFLINVTGTQFGSTACSIEIYKNGASILSLSADGSVTTTLAIGDTIEWYQGHYRKYFNYGTGYTCTITRL